MLFLILVVYVVCAVVSFGYIFALWQRCFPSLANKDKSIDFTLAIFGASMWPVYVPVLAIFLGAVGRGVYKGFKFNLKDEGV